MQSARQGAAWDAFEQSFDVWVAEAEAAHAMRERDVEEKLAKAQAEARVNVRREALLREGERLVEALRFRMIVAAALCLTFSITAFASSHSSAAAAACLGTLAGVCLVQWLVLAWGWHWLAYRQRLLLA